MPSKQDIEDGVGYWLCMSSHMYQRAMNERLAPQGMTFRQAQVLGWLALCDELPQHELAQRMMIEPATLVGVLDRMARDGWIARIPCSEDRRRKLIRLTPQAEPAWAKVAEVSAVLRAQATAGFSPDELVVLKSMLERIRENLVSDGRAGATGPCGETTDIPPRDERTNATAAAR